MELNDSEKRMLRWLRGQHENWKSTRVIITVCSVFLLIGAIWGIYRGESTYSIVPWLALGGFGLSYSVACWSGRPEISLLLKLAEEAMSQQPRQEKT